MLCNLRETDRKCRTGRAEDREQLNTRYHQLVSEGKELQSQLIDAAIVACAKQPDENPDLANFLAGIVYLLLGNEEYEEAVRVAQLLIDNSAANPTMVNACGIAAFAVGEFNLAEKHLLVAKNKRVLNEVGQNCLKDISYYKEAWEKEKTIRSAETVAGNLPRVVLTTSQGEIELELFENEAPNTVANFISLVEKGFYDGLTFHQVVHRFRAEAGCPEGDGTGGPGYTISKECRRADHRLHFRGSLAMATAGLDSHGSRFYLTFLPAKRLDGTSTVFGRIVRGIDILARLQRRTPRDPLSVQINPHRNIIVPPADKIIKAKVLRKRNHAYQPIVRPTRSTRPVLVSRNASKGSLPWESNTSCPVPAA
jgi:cyclophilin family peptidyl-prolyl cis-trans isomerase